MSLKPKHHAELNSCGISRTRFDQLRREYAGDTEALRSIDIYDPLSEYKTKFRQYRDALQSGNQAAQTRLERWFERQGYS